MIDVSSHFKIQEYNAELAKLSSQLVHLKVSCSQLEKELNMASKSLAMGLCEQLNIGYETKNVALLLNFHSITNLKAIQSWVLGYLVEIGYPYQNTDINKLFCLLEIELNKRVLDIH